MVPLKGLFITVSQKVMGENKIIGRSHSPLVKSRHELKGIGEKQASEKRKHKRSVRKTQRAGGGLCGQGTSQVMGGNRNAVPTMRD